MKKILLTVFIAASLLSCSTDNDILVETTTTANNISQTAEELVAKGYAGTSVTKLGVATIDIPVLCVKTCTALYDNVGTFQNPVWSFIANVPAGINPGSSFKISLEIQQNDCEDITVGIGDILSITDNTVYSNIYTSPPFINRKPAELLQCYRWRIRLIPINVRGTTIINNCTYVSPWYDAPMG